MVILTGQGDDTLLTEFMENGANRYLTKDDFFIDSLIETIRAGDYLIPLSCLSQT